MKKKLLLFVLLFAGLMSAQADNAGAIVSIKNIRSIVRGYTGSFDVVLNESNDKTFETLGLDVQLPTGFTYTRCSPGKLLTAKHVQNISTSEQANNTERIGSYANPTAGFTASQGVLLTIYFSVASDAVSGTAYVKGARFGLNGTDWVATETSAELTVGNTITLDENETSAPAPFNDVNVWVDRTISSGKWNTICLPFPMTEAQVDAAFGSDVQIGDFNGIETDDDGNIKVKFTKATDIAANHPYIIKVSSTVEGFGVTDAAVNIDPQEAMVNKGSGTSNSKIRAMIGVYEPTDLDESWLYLKDNKFMYSKGAPNASKLKPYHAYFRFGNAFDYQDFENDGLGITAAPRIHISYDEISTGIKVVSEKNAEDNQYYNLQGCKVSNPTKGLY
ncbi:MAG: hypothetical protein J6O49_01630, partial [Bacteroidaceae bacterium]|nr:hypothetical protein [Bacteroidaceae bacterium]